MSTGQSVKLADIYKFLAQAIRYPEADWFNDEFLAVYHTLLEGLEWPEGAQVPTKVDEQSLEDVQVEYTRLFINAVPHVVAPPYGSVFIDGSLNGVTADQTRKYYREHGFDITSNEFPDHIVTELDFVALLEEGEEGSSEEFLAQLFRPWFDQFRAKVLEESQDAYISTTIKLIDFFTREEEEGD
ncbi:MAG: molecular chaperone TorD family protein [Thermodesulfobacteriota bacterium]